MPATLCRVDSPRPARCGARAGLLALVETFGCTVQRAECREDVAKMVMGLWQASTRWAPAAAKPMLATSAQVIKVGRTVALGQLIAYAKSYSHSTMRCGTVAAICAKLSEMYRAIAYVMEPCGVYVLECGTQVHVGTRASAQLLSHGVVQKCTGYHDELTGGRLVCMCAVQNVADPAVVALPVAAFYSGIN
jgi:hypothetical protein